jgi:hypothetical protein
MVMIKRNLFFDHNRLKSQKQARIKPKVKDRCKSYKSKRIKNLMLELTIVNEDVKFLSQR